jgi:CMP-N-acetylneuraminic acid synthetase
VREAIRLLEERGADSVVSVKALPLTHGPECALQIAVDGVLVPWVEWLDIHSQPSRRQSVEPTYIRDGTCYAFRRRTVERFGHIYGQHVVPLIIPPDETCELDTEDDWARLEQRIRTGATA